MTSETEQGVSTDAVEAPAGGMRAHVIRGILVVGVASVVMRSGGLVGQFVTGKLLLPEDFGLYASTLAFSGLSVSMLSSLRPVVIERLTKGESVDDLWRLVLGALGLFAVLVILLRNPLAQAFNRPDAAPLLGAIALTLPLTFSQVIGIGRLGAQLRFNDSSRILTTATLARHGSMIVAALLGAGVWSFVIPLYVEPLVQAALLWRATGAPPSLRGPWRSALTTYRTTLPWLALTGIALAVSLNGDYLAISPLETKTVVGLYSFGYMLSAALTQPFTMAATNILVPSFASVSDEERVRKSYLEALSMLLSITGIAFAGLAVVGGPLIHLVWGGKWDSAVIAVVLISAGTPYRILQPTCYSLLQARGKWKKHSLLMVFNATAAITGAIVGASIGGLAEIAAGVGLAGAMVGAIVAVIAGHEVGSSTVSTLKQVLRGSVPAAAGLAVAFAAVPGLIPSLSAGIARGAIFGVTSGVLLLVMFRSSLKDIVGSVRNR